MKKTLDTLIRLQKTEIDRLRQQHNQLLDLQDAQIAGINQIADSLGTEQKYVSKFRAGDETLPVGVPNYGAFSQRMKINRERHEQNLRTLAPRIEASLVALTDAFAERKRYEIIAENREEREREEIKQAQQQFLDENTILRYAQRLD